LDLNLPCTEHGMSWSTPAPQRMSSNMTAEKANGASWRSKTPHTMSRVRRRNKKY
jgi:hypothetical protein